MSWFDATGFANLAKSALKEAQKTIDKALDIKDEDQKPLESHTEDTSDFFASWGLKSDVHHDVQPHRDKMKESKQEATSSIWGSFTGSFFESPKFNEMDHNAKANIHSKSLQTTPIENEKKLVSSSSFSEDYKVKSLNPRKEPKQAEICKEKNIHDQNVLSQDVNTCNDLKQISLETIDTSITFAKDDKVNDSNSNINNSKIVEYSLKEMKDINNKMEDVKMRFEDKETREYDSDSPISTSNRLSFVSPENDKKSLESVEILGSRSNTEYTTSPDSDSCSVSNLASPATGTKVNSESVEILPDSLVTSPSSVEVLGDWKSDTSPYLSPIDQKNSDSSSILDRDDSVTPCWDDINVPQLISKENVINPSSSDISPYESPMEEVKTLHENLYISNMDEQSSTETYLGIESHLHKSLSSGHSMKVLSENVETIPYTDEKDEVSLAEDSYTSTSESTVITMLETLQQKEQVKNKVEIPTSVSPNDKIHDLCLDSKLTLKKANTDTKLDLNLDSLTEKHNLHLPIEAITTQPIRKPEYFDGAGKISESDRKNFDRLINSTIEPAEAEHSIEITYLFKPEKIEVSDQVLISTDSSCEGTLIESSSEENPQLIHKSEGRVLQAPLNSSSYVKTMLEDAMIEKGSEIIEAEIQGTEMPRENSPISSESRSDLVKIGSDQTSGHTSGDELETTTSSDIEIISRYSPNGDSSSIQSRQNLAKLQSAKGGDLLLKTLKTKGHSRELSEISVGSDEANVEIEKLLKRIQEMTEILEARESKLIDVSRMNMELHEQNNNLKKQLDNFEKHAEQNQNINQITDEYTQRLSALERKFQQAIRERDSLRKNLEQLKVEAATRLSSQELSTLNAEKDEIIKELREEGEKLSKQQLQHSNIIKKLRVKEKENDALVKSQKEQIEEQISELERLKRSLRAKEEVELSQIDAVYSLTARTKTLEKEITTLQKQLENMMHNADTYKKNLDTTKMELSETKKILAATEVELKEATTNAGESCQLFAQVEDLKIKLRESEEMHVKKEEFLKHENSELLKRLEAAEARSEELSESVSMATKPLLRQLEQLQANLLHKSNTFMKQEKTLSEKNIELQTKIENLLETDRYLKEENINLKSKISQLEAKFTVKENERKRLQELYDELVIQKEKFVEQNMRQRQMIETLEQSHSAEIMELKREIVALENKLSIEKAATDAERRKNHAMSEQQQNIEDNERLSPSTSTEEDSVNTIDSIWPLYNSTAENKPESYTMTFDSIRAGSSSTSIFENLQAQLKQKDGEIQQLQWELSRRNIERDVLNSELSTLTLKIEELNVKVMNVAVLNESLQEIQTRYDALLQMYGEKMEENQELRLDLQDVKEMYKTQIDQLLKRDT
ncbi:TATA element modulatory factor isoform X1 [Apis dorsata]|uniref:TATA element modulatory factor isoform X1 n=1 Tax=Apis dorsata TaxID=7462 RepID=UPI0003DF7FFF|nr:TATA element modulatory factor isoform X1 [Apis dorsata]XP_006612752.1 TATA element modulatory factor isoform X1 [Apis dorsata]XP_006612753.1 TATA element modulatory factor isoform X1 [Apis dorsata]